MKLSKTAWNNVIIFSVMLIILLINSTNNRLFPDNDTNDGLVLPEHSIILTLSMTLSNNTTIKFERIARSWKTTNQGMLFDLTNQQIEQMMFAWQQSSGLLQADQLLVYNQRKKLWLALPATMKNQLIPML